MGCVYMRFIWFFWFSEIVLSKKAHLWKSLFPVEAAEKDHQEAS